MSVWSQEVYEVRSIGLLRRGFAMPDRHTEI